SRPAARRACHPATGPDGAPRGSCRRSALSASGRPAAPPPARPRAGRSRRPRELSLPFHLRCLRRLGGLLLQLLLLHASLAIRTAEDLATSAAYVALDRKS